MEDVYEDIFRNGSLGHNFTDFHFAEDIITPYKNLPFAICYFLLSLVGLVGNAMVMYIFLRYAKMRTVSNIYIFNLAIGDTLRMLTLLFFATQEATYNWPFGIFWCKFVMSAEFINPIACISFVTVMSIDRCVVLYRPLLASQWRNPKVATLLSIAVWVFSILAALHVTFFASVHEDNSKNSICYLMSHDKSYYFLYLFCYLYLGLLQPVELILLCLCMTAVKAPPADPPVNVSKHKGSDRTRMVVMLFVIHMVFWLPSYTLNMLLVQPVIDLDILLGYSVLFNMSSCFHVLTAMKSCINPILYWCFSCEFRQYFARVLCCKKKNRRSYIVGYKAESSLEEINATLIN